MTTQSQNSQILSYLQSGGKLTAIDALHRFNCLRLSGRINEKESEKNCFVQSSKLN